MPAPQPPARRAGRPKLHPLETAVTRRRVGDANPRGRLERPKGRFKLASGLNAGGALLIADALALIVADWERQVAAGTISAQGIENYLVDARSLVRRAHNLGFAELRDIDTRFVYEWSRLPSSRKPDEPPAVNTRRKRIVSARALFTTAAALGLHDRNPAQAVDDPKRTDRYVNAFTPTQIEQLKIVATHTVEQTRVPAALALMLLGASLAETGAARVGDVDFADRRLWLHDGGYRSRPRWVPIDDPWCRDALSDRIATLYTAPHFGPTMRLCYSPTAKTTQLNRTSAISNMMNNLLKRARVYQEGVHRAESLREYVAFRVYAETGRVESVANRLGIASLDTAAHIVGLDWTTTFGIDAPPPDLDERATP